MAQTPLPRPHVNVLFSANQIAARIATLADAIVEKAPRNLLVVPVLKGSFIFAADLVRALHHAGLTPEIDFMTLGSYGTGTTSSGEVRVVQDVSAELAGRGVLIVDDILETGRTLAHAKMSVLERGASHVTTCVLLNKPVARATAISADLKAFDCPDVFVVGYGMDLAHRYRELPFVGQLVENSSERD
ncbi:MAG: hypoxanthine phosphoribosyltransferase [Pseudomonadota bacterium]